MTTFQSPPELLATCWTTAGDALPLSERETSRLDLLERIEKAASAGYRGFGVFMPDLSVALLTYSWAQIRGFIEDHGVRHVEIELLTDWFADGDLRDVSDGRRRAMLEAAQELGARHIKVAGSFGQEPAPDRIVAEFARLCDDAAVVGTRIALEPMPFSSVKDLDEGLRIVEAANRPNGGLLVDIWHVARTGTTYGRVAEIPKQRFFAVELDDAAVVAQGSLLDDTLHRRRLCGEGDLDVPSFIHAVNAAGYEGPWGVEILSDQHRALGLDEQARRSFETALAQFS